MLPAEVKLSTVKNIQSEEPILPPVQKTGRKKAWPVAVIILALVLAVGLFAVVLAPKKSYRGPSYYIDDTVVYGDATDNRFYRTGNNHFILVIHFPETISRPYAGYGEHMFWFTDATHVAHLAVVDPHQRFIRYRIKKFSLTNGSGRTYEPYFFQQHVYGDAVKKYKKDFRKEPEDSEVQRLMKEITKLMSKLDFACGDNLAEPYFGYRLWDAPKELVIDFEIEIYSVDGQIARNFSDKIRIHRVDEDPTNYLKKQLK